MQIAQHQKQAILVAVHHLGFTLSLHEVTENKEIVDTLNKLKPLLEKEIGKISEDYYCAQVRLGYAMLNLIASR